MTRQDYEEQKRRLAEQHRALLEMAETAYQYQVRALDIVWRMLSGEGPGDLLPAPLPAPQAAAPAAPVRRRLGPWELYSNIIDVLAGLPDPFTYSDVYNAIGYEPDRGSLHRALQELKKDGHVIVHSSGTGNRPMQYRWTQARIAEAAT
jgi:hypothetical protein